MPRLPGPESAGYQSFVAPVADRPMASYQPGIEATAQGQAGAITEQTGAQQVQTADTLQGIKDKMAAADGSMKFLSGMQDLMEKAKKDPDYATMPERYGQALRQLLDQSSAGIGSNIARAEFQENNRRYMHQGLEGVANLADAKNKDHGRANLFQTINDAQDRAANSGELGMTGAFAEAMGRSIDAARASGFVSESEAVEMKRNAALGSIERMAQTGIHTDPGKWAGLLARPGVIDHAVQAGIDKAVADHPEAPWLKDYLTRTSLVENSGRPTDDPAKKYTGAFQLGQEEAARYGVTDRNNPEQSAAGAARLALDNAAALQKAGIAPTPANVYLAHQQGAAGAVALLTHRDQPAVDVLSQFHDAPADKKITQNGGRLDMTASQFTQHIMQGQFGAAAPDAAYGGLIFPKTGTAIDLLPADKRAGYYWQAQNQAQAMTRLSETKQKDAMQDTINSYATDILNHKNMDTLSQKIANDPSLDAGQKFTLTHQLRAEIGLESRVVPTEENQRLWYTLMGQSSDPSFTDVDLNGYIGKIPLNQWQGLALKQRSWSQKEVEESQKTTDINQAMTTLQPMLTQAQIEKPKHAGAKADAYNEFRGRMLESINQWREDNNGKRPGQEDIMKLGAQALAKGTQRGTAGLIMGERSVRAYQVPPEQFHTTIPADQTKRAQMADELRKGMLRPDQIETTIPDGEKPKWVATFSSIYKRQPTPQELQKTYSEYKIKQLLGEVQ